MDKLLGINVVKELFAFNLLPPKTKEEIAEEMQRKRTNTYGVLLPVATLVIAVLLTLVNAILIEPSLNGWKTQVKAAEAELNDPNSFIGQLKATNGELVIKTDFVADPISRNINFNRIFEVRDAVFNNNTTGSVATSYAREASGVFVVNAISSSRKGPEEILERFQQQEKVEAGSVELRQVSFDASESEYRYSIGFIIKPDL